MDILVPIFEEIEPICQMYYNKIAACFSNDRRWLMSSEEKITVVCPDGATREYKKGISLLEMSKDFEHLYKTRIMAGRVDNDIKELGFQVDSDCRVQFVDLTHSDGIRIYQRSLSFVMIKAVYDLFPDRKVKINHSVTLGLYCEIEGSSQLTREEVVKIESRMHELVERKIPFIKKEVTREEAREIFEKYGRMDRYRSIEHRAKPYVTFYECDGLYDYFYGYMAPHTGYVDKFQLIYYPPGFVMLHPQKNDPTVVPVFQETRKLFNIFDEYEKWGRILGVPDIGTLNNMVRKGEINNIIRISEALHEKKIAQIADMITQSRPIKKIVLISGPSSSGKTTFAQRLSIQLRVNGLRPFIISLDNYFKNREAIPRDESGEYDFEALDAIDLDLFNLQLEMILKGYEVEMPVYDFETGSRMPEGKKLKVGEDDILIVEGIHGLNDKVTEGVPSEKKFKIYISALTSLNIDDHNRIPSTDTRMIRRIVRDNQFRNTDALGTLKMWPSVRRGEKLYIFPFQENADIMFNSALIYELGVLKVYAEPLLKEIDRSHPEYSEAKRLLEFLGYFLPIDCREVPLNSILREFIGGSCF